LGKPTWPVLCLWQSSGVEPCLVWADTYSVIGEVLRQTPATLDWLRTVLEGTRTAAALSKIITETFEETMEEDGDDLYNSRSLG
jgi:hypothetical protein